MGVPCATTTTAEVAAGDRLDVSLSGGIYTLAIESAELTYRAGLASAVPTGADGKVYHVTDATRLSGTGVVVPHSSVPAAPGLWYYENRWQPGNWQAPWGVMGYAEITANLAAVTTIADASGLSITFTAAANRRYRISAHVGFTTTVANDVAGIHIADGSNVTLQLWRVHMPNTATYFAGSPAVVESPAAGSVTYKVRCERIVGTGSVVPSAATTSPALILVEDIGPNGSPA